MASSAPATADGTTDEPQNEGSKLKTFLGILRRYISSSLAPLSDFSAPFFALLTVLLAPPNIDGILLHSAGGGQRSVSRSGGLRSYRILLSEMGYALVNWAQGGFAGHRTKLTADSSCAQP